MSTPATTRVSIATLLLPRARATPSVLTKRRGPLRGNDASRTTGRSATSTTRRSRWHRMAVATGNGDLCSLRRRMSWRSPRAPSAARRCCRRTPRCRYPSHSATSAAGWSAAACTPDSGCDAQCRYDRHPTGQQDRQVPDVVPVPVADRAAVHHHAVVQQRPVAVRCRLELVEEVGEERAVVGVDLRQGLDLAGVPTVVGDRVMRVRDPDLRERGAALLASHLEGMEMTRVVSVWNASVCMSNISFACSS